MKLRLLFIITAALLLGGCCWILPEGDPPEGNITNNPQKSVQQIKTPAEAVDYFVSSLTVALLNNCPGEKVQIKSDSSSSGAAARVLLESGRITGNKLTYTDSRWVLKAMYSKGKMQMQLLDSGKSLWNESVECPFDPAQMR